jgi:tetratricopeptide (TPR) repeat protein
MTDTTDKANFLRITMFAGLILFLLTSLTLGVFYLVDNSGKQTQKRIDIFVNLLREYDDMARDSFGTQREYELLNRELDKIEKRAISVESWLSVLKRRRALAGVHQDSLENYRKSLERAREAYPASESVAALCAEALIKNTAINRQAEIILREYLLLFNGNSFNNLRLSLHVLLGDFQSPQRAAAITSSLVSDGTESINVDLIIMKILRGDVQGASSDIFTILNGSYPGNDTLRFAAEFYYDFGDMRRSAQVFSLIHDDKARVREADALYLAGFTENARYIWSYLTPPASRLLEPFETRSLYNLAVTSEDNSDVLNYLQRIVDFSFMEDTDWGQYAHVKEASLIRFSRFFNLSAAVEILERTKGVNPVLFPYADLEICKRMSLQWPLDRQIAEAWRLLDRHPENEDLYRWSAWMFLYQRNFNEAEILLNRMERLGLTRDWTNIFKAVVRMFNGDLEKAEDLFASVTELKDEWSVNANLGRIMEEQRSFNRALQFYQIAAGQAAASTENLKTVSRLYVRIARCFNVQGRFSDTLESLQYAVELDPDNLTARLELDRLLLQ